MAYQALYRRYRSQRFSELRGQAHVVSALRNAVRDGRVSHAYLFSGPRGTGKTSTARIMAKALNCDHLQDGEPCGECESCVAIEHGTSYDLQELDAASNNGVDAMRDLIGKAALGSPGRTKVYILDEVHMLSTAASNALLKTLEEPPPHVVFVLATTDPEKVLRTIRSRTQHLEFHLLAAEELSNHVRWVADDAGLAVTDEMVDYVLRKGGGSARDTLSALDQVVAAGSVVDSADGVDELVDAICGSDTGAALGAVDGAVKVGRDPRVLGEALLGRLRDVFLQRMGVALDHLPDGDRSRIAGWAEQLGDRAVTRALEAVGEALLEMRQAPDARIPLEVALVRITRTDTDASLDAVLARLDRLERTMAVGGSPAAAADSTPAPATTPATGGAPPPPARSGPVSNAPRSRPGDAARAALPGSRAPAPPRPQNPSRASAPPPEPESEGSAPAVAIGPSFGRESAPVSSASDLAPARDELTLAWGDSVLPGLRGLAKAMYTLGRFLESEGKQAVFALPNEAHRLKCAEKQADVEAALAKHFGRPVPLRLVVDRGVEPGDGGTSSNPEPPADPDDEPESVDVSQLADAPADDRTPVDRLTEVFPGAQVVDGD